jgi:hypothetical protein
MANENTGLLIGGVVVGGILLALTMRRKSGPAEPNWLTELPPGTPPEVAQAAVQANLHSSRDIAAVLSARKDLALQRGALIAQARREAEARLAEAEAADAADEPGVVEALTDMARSGLAEARREVVQSATSAVDYALDLAERPDPAADVAQSPLQPIEDVADMITHRWPPSPERGINVPDNDGRIVAFKPRRADDWSLIATARAEAEDRGIPVDGFVMQMFLESRFDPTAYNADSGAKGVGQFIVATGTDWGLIDISDWVRGIYYDGSTGWAKSNSARKRQLDTLVLSDPNTVDRRGSGTSNIRAAARYMVNLHGRFNGSWALAAAAYNWGPWKVQQWQAGNRDYTPPAHETQKYVAALAPYYHEDVPAGFVSPEILALFPYAQ